MTANRKWEQLLGWKVVQQKLVTADIVESYFRGGKAEEYDSFQDFLLASGADRDALSEVIAGLPQPKAETAQSATRRSARSRRQGAVQTQSFVGMTTAAHQPRRTFSSRRQAAQNDDYYDEPDDQDGSGSHGRVAPGKATPALIIGGAILLVVVAAIAAIMLMPDRKLEQIQTRAKQYLAKNQVAKYGALMSKNSDYKDHAGLAELQKQAQDLSESNSKQIVTDVRELLAADKLPQVNERLLSAEEECLPEQIRAINSELKPDIVDAQSRATAWKLKENDGPIAAVKSLEAIPEKQRSSQTNKLLKELRAKAEEDLKSELIAAYGLQLNGKSTEARSTIAKLQKAYGIGFQQNFQVALKTLSECREASSVIKEFASVATADYDKKLNELFKFDQSLRGIPGFESRKLKFVRDYQARIEKMRKRADLVLWQAVNDFKLENDSAGIFALRKQIIAEISEAFRKSQLVLTNRGKLDQVAQNFKDYKQADFPLSAEFVAKINERIQAARKNLALIQAWEKFAAVQSTLRKHYKAHELREVKSILQKQSVKHDYLKRWLDAENMVFADCNKLVEMGLKGLEKDKGQEVKIELLTGAEVKGELKKAENKKDGIHIQIGAGVSVHSPWELSWETLGDYSRLHSFGASRPLRAVLEFALRGEAAVGKLSAERGSKTVETLLDLIENRPGFASDTEENSGGDSSASSSDPTPAEPIAQAPKRPEPGIPGAVRPGAHDHNHLSDTAPKELIHIIELRRDGQTKKAVEKVEELLKKYPNDADVNGTYGLFLFDVGRFDESMKYLRKAAAANDSWVDNYWQMRSMYSFLYGDDKATLEHAQKLADTDPLYSILPTLIKPPELSRTESSKGHYLVYADKHLTSLGGHEFAGRMMELIYRAYSKVFPFDKDEKVVYRCYVFSKNIEFQRFSTSIGHDASTAAGFFAPLTRILVINADPQNAPVNKYGFTVDAIDTMFHEGFHQFIDIYIPDVPIWFNEGLAEYFGPSILIGKNKLKVGHFVRTHPDARYWTRLQTIKAGVNGEAQVWPLTLRDFVNLSDASFMNPAQRSMNYAQGWSVIHFFLHCPKLAGKGQKLVKTYFKLLLEGRGPRYAHSKTFGKLNYTELDPMWKAYVKTL